MLNNFEKYVLDNGLTIYTYVDSKKHSTIVNLVTKFGGAYNDFYVDGKHMHIEDGMAHFLEHLLLETGPYGDLMNYFGERQMSSNGTTYLNRTEYYFQAVEGLDDGIFALLTSINQAHFTKDDVEETKKAIYQEIRRSQDNKFQKLNVLTNRMLFQNISYQSVLGTLKRMESLTYEEVLMCYETFYQPQNQILFVVGNFDRDHIIELVKSIYCKFLPSKTSFTLYDYHEPVEVKKEYDFICVSTNDSFVQVTFKLDFSQFSAEEKLDLDFYFSSFYKMNFGIASSIYQELFDQNIIYDGISYGNCYGDSYCLFHVGCYVHGDYDEMFVRKILETIQSPVYDRELFELYQNHERMQLAIRSENLWSIIDPFIENVISFDYPYIDSVQDVDRRSFDRMKELIGRLDFSYYCVSKLISEEDIKK